LIVLLLFYILESEVILMPCGGGKKDKGKDKGKGKGKGKDK
jgi:hypothetical protein